MVQPVPQAPNPALVWPRSLRTYGLFGGIGGIERGLERAGHQTVGFCELDPAARAVLNHHFRDIPVHDDVCTLETIDPGVELLSAGFPCQDLSQMGSGLGLKGERSGLVREVLRLMETTKVPLVLLENVRFMLHLGRGAAMNSILTSIEELGYNWAYRVVDTRAFGLPQKRERVIILASRTEDPRTVLLEQDVGVPAEKADEGRRQACGFYWTEGRWGIGWVENGIPTLKGSSAFGIACPPAVVKLDGSIVVPGVADAERLQGFPRGWTRPALKVEAKRGSQWRLINNAVSVPVAEWVGRRLSLEPRAFAGSGKAMREGKPFPRAAWNVGDGRFEAAVSAWPVRRKQLDIEAVLKGDKPLSFRASSGFHRRLVGGGLKTPTWFRSVLEDHISAMELLRRTPADRRLDGARTPPMGT